jgi:hypothetical protein
MTRSLTTLFLLLTALVLTPPTAQGQEAPPADNSGAVELNRGPLHEAFAAPTDVPAQTLVITRQPPDAIEEVPPDRPADPNAMWLGGYWAWNDDLKDFMWISGVWRVPPPDRTWVAGYWTQVQGGWQWVPGFWAAAQQQAVQYLPAPPQTQEMGPNSPAPGDDYFWAPGSWEWSGARYAWHPGRWAASQANWVWIPPTYYWTPNGYAYVPGYWDYVLASRGLCYAPVYFTGGVYRRPGFVYAPSVVIDVPLLSFNLFVRPGYCHYYFGDYYAASYAGAGIYAWYLPRHGMRPYYDPIFTHDRWAHRREPQWTRNLVTWHDMMVGHPDLRPPHRVAELARYDQRLRTDAKLRTVLEHNHFSAANVVSRVAVSQPMAEFRARPNSYVRVNTIAAEERNRMTQVARQQREVVQQRRQLEGQRNIAAPGAAKQPRTLALPRTAVETERIGRTPARTEAVTPRTTTPQRTVTTRENTVGTPQRTVTPSRETFVPRTNNPPTSTTPRETVPREAVPRREVTPPAREATPPRQVAPVRETPPPRQAAPVRETPPATRQFTPSDSPRTRDSSPPRRDNSSSGSNRGPNRDRDRSQQ